MPNVKYIGTCDKTDSLPGIGLHWTPGQVRAVTGTVAATLLQHQDTWENAGGDDKSDETASIGLKDAGKPTETPLPVVDFHNMNKQDMIAFARDKMGVKIDKSLSEANVRHKVIDAFANHHLEQDKEEAGDK